MSMFNKVTKTFQWGPHTVTMETGEIARQSTGAVLVNIDDTVVLATVVGAKEARPGQDFFPLTVDYVEKFYAAGRIPGGFFKREGRPSEKETLTCRLIDRPIRPLFPDGFFNEVQVIVHVLSVDPEIDHIRGPEDAQLTLVEYVDFECAYCAHATGSWDDLRAHFGDDLRYVVRHLPHHPHGPIAARANGTLVSDRTGVATAAIRNARAGDDGMKMCRSPVFRAVAAYWIFIQPSKTCTGILAAFAPSTGHLWKSGPGRSPG